MPGVACSLAERHLRRDRAMVPEINGIPLAHRKGLWFADVPSKSYGTLEAVLDGSKESPDPLQAEALRRFNKNIDEKVNKLRSSVLLGFLLRAGALAPKKRRNI